MKRFSIWLILCLCISSAFPQEFQDFDSQEEYEGDSDTDGSELQTHLTSLPEQNAQHYYLPSNGNARTFYPFRLHRPVADIAKLEQERLEKENSVKAFTQSLIKPNYFETPLFPPPAQEEEEVTASQPERVQEETSTENPEETRGEEDNYTRSKRSHFGGPVHSGAGSHSQSQTVSANFGPFGISVSQSEAQAHSQSGHPGFGGPGIYGGHPGGFGPHHGGGAAVAGAGAGSYPGGGSFAHAGAQSGHHGGGFGPGYPHQAYSPYNDPYGSYGYGRPHGPGHYNNYNNGPVYGGYNGRPIHHGGGGLYGGGPGGFHHGGGPGYHHGGGGGYYPQGPYNHGYGRSANPKKDGPVPVITKASASVSPNAPPTASSSIQFGS